MEGEEAAEAAAAGLSCLNESCVSHILSLTSPLDVSRSSAVSTIFRSASESDTIWEKFLPPDYPEILSRSTSAVHFSSKKELFFKLCDSILVDDGTKMFWLEKSSGRKCYSLPARELFIMWGDTPWRWKWISRHESRFAEVAELLGVNWLEISGKFDIHMLSSETTYAAFLIVNFTEDVHGLSYPPMELMVKVESNVCKHEALLLATESERQRYQGSLEQKQELMNTLGLSRMSVFRCILTEGRRIPLARADGWLEIEMGEFFVDKRGTGEVEMSLMEIKGGHLKGGLIIEGIEIRPKR